MGKAKKARPDTAHTTFCILHRVNMESLYWFMVITPDTVQALIKVEDVITNAQKLKQQLQNEIDRTNEEEI